MGQQTQKAAYIFIILRDIGQSDDFRLLILRITHDLDLLCVRNKNKELIRI